jgi:molybdopterin biosynthesis enzyme MoaB
VFLENIVRVQRPAFDARIDGVDELVRLFSDEDTCLAMLSRMLFGHP